MPPLPFNLIAKQYDRLNDLLSFGFHRWWKRRLVRKLCEAAPIKSPVVLDVATGTGDLVALFRKRLPADSEVSGLDPCPEMLSIARERMPAITWRQGESEKLPFANSSVGVLSCAFGVRNFRDRANAYAEWKRVLVPGGVAGIIEIHPVGSGWLRGPIQFYWKYLVPLLGQFFAKRSAYEYLRDTGAAFLTPPQLVSEVARSGLQPLYFTSLFPCEMVTLSLFINAEGISKEPSEARHDGGGDLFLGNRRGSHGALGIQPPSRADLVGSFSKPQAP